MEKGPKSCVYATKWNRTSGGTPAWQHYLAASCLHGSDAVDALLEQRQAHLQYRSPPSSHIIPVRFYTLNTLMTPLRACKPPLLIMPWKPLVGRLQQRTHTLKYWKKHMKNSKNGFVLHRVLHREYAASLVFGFGAGGYSQALLSSNIQDECTEKAFPQGFG